MRNDGTKAVRGNVSIFGYGDWLMKIYVGNLPAGTSDTDLEDLFSPYGTVISARVVTSSHTGRSRGFGFVEMLRECGQRAIAQVDGQQIDGVVLRVNEAKEIRSSDVDEAGGV